MLYDVHFIMKLKIIYIFLSFVSCRLYTNAKRDYFQHAPRNGEKAGLPK